MDTPWVMDGDKTAYCPLAFSDTTRQEEGGHRYCMMVMVVGHPGDGDGGHGVGVVVGGIGGGW